MATVDAIKKPVKKNKPTIRIVKNDVGKFSANDAATVVRKVRAARVIVRAVALAVHAQIDGAVNYADNKTGRWHPAISEAESLLNEVRDVLMETGDAPAVDWFTPLSLLEAMGAALWFDSSSHNPLDATELEELARAVIDVLDSSTLFDCEDSGVNELARKATER